MNEQLSNTGNHFLEEILQKTKNDFFEFQVFQRKALETLNQFHKVCQKNNIKYYLAYGSLLGAIRDGGQIPWDYDIDVWVEYADANKLIKALDYDLPKDYYFETRLKGKDCYHNHMRVSPVEYSSEIIHVDVFWLAGASDDIEKNKKRLHKNMKYYRLFMFKHIKKKYVVGNRKSEKVIYFLTKCIASFLPDFIVDNYYKKSAGLSITECKYVTDNAHLTNMESVWFSDRQLIKIANGMEFYVPSGFDKILKHRYGDYSKYLDISDRIREMDTSLKRIRRLCKRDA